MKTTKLKVTGMTCGHCKAAVERALRSQPGVANATVDLVGGGAEVEYDEEAVAIDRLIEAVTEEGYKAAVTE